MEDIVIVSAVRTAVGKFGGSLAKIPATEHPGSWWTEWFAWLQPFGGKQVAAPKAYGNGRYKAIEPAPGRYVKAKA